MITRQSAIAAVLLAFSFNFLYGQSIQSPVADKKAIVVSGQCRFTVLTSRCIRMEWSSTDAFEDHSSLVFTNRRLPVPKFRTGEDNGWLTITTDDLKLRYKAGSGIFTPSNLKISFELNDRQVDWKPGMRDDANLGGTIRTLDGVEGATPLDPGLLSRDGWVIVDDSKRPLFDSSDWAWVMPRPDSNKIDWYFFGYGHDYKKQLGDFTRMAGRIPMPPRFAFGYWWSRYWAYTDTEFEDLVREFEQHDVPIDVLVVDMDWHKTFSLRWDRQPKDQAGQSLGWTGYTWDSTFFPNPPQFLSWCDEHGLRTPLNLHPASGIQPHEEHYPEMAAAMGIDPKSKRYVPFDIVDKKFATNYLKYMIHPLEEVGVDFWWLDWQAWGTTNIPGVTPTWWLNYVFFTDMERQGKNRPLLFHRWGGLGNHRYEIGFSGDVVSVWPSLAFQPYFTATAANVGYGYWSHDIGGHMPGIVTPELYTRWIQFGIFSPILRTHTTKNPESERRIWAYPPEYFRVMRDAFLLRYSMIPYIYTEARKTYESGVSICRPMYYDYPESGEAYTFKDQYQFGDRMIVAPVTAPASEDSLSASKSVWLPPGEWIEWFTGARLTGPAVINRHFTISEIPVYVKTGTIVPMQPPMRNSHERPVDPLILTIFAGDSSSTRLYEDQGNTNAYQNGEFAWTPIQFRTERNGDCSVRILPALGTYDGKRDARSYEIRLVGTLPPSSVTADGATVPYDGRAAGWRYDGEHLTTIISVPSVSVLKPVTITVRGAGPSSQEQSRMSGFPGTLERLRAAMDLLNHQWPKDWSPDPLVRAVQTGHRMTLDPSSARKEIAGFQDLLSNVRKSVNAMPVDAGILGRVRTILSTLP